MPIIKQHLAAAAAAPALAPAPAAATAQVTTVLTVDLSRAAAAPQQPQQQTSGAWGRRKHGLVACDARVRVLLWLGGGVDRMLVECACVCMHLST